MRLKTPSFWYNGTPVPAWLPPLSAVYLAAYKFYTAVRGRNPYASSIPVICVGNAVAGGSGKTPTVLALLDVILTKGLARNPVILTRGYGGKLSGPVKVEDHDVADVGDEALLLSSRAPVIVSRDRVAGAKLAEAMRADLIIMDDGLQNPSLHQDIRLLVVDSKTGFGNGHVLPAGPLREPATDALGKADALLLIDSGNAHAMRLPALKGKGFFTARLRPDVSPDPRKSYIAFAGIGRPEKFFETLNSIGLKILGQHSYADHHPYTSSELEFLKAEASSRNAILITTDKDHVRLPPEWKNQIAALPVTLEFQSGDRVADFLRTRLGRA